MAILTPSTNFLESSSWGCTDTSSSDQFSGAAEIGETSGVAPAADERGGDDFTARRDGEDGADGDGGGEDDDDDDAREDGDDEGYSVSEHEL